MTKRQGTYFCELCGHRGQQQEFTDPNRTGPFLLSRFRCPRCKSFQIGYGVQEFQGKAWDDDEPGPAET